MGPVITYADDGAYSVIIGLDIVHQVSRSEALAFIQARIDGPAEEWLDSPVSASEWRASHIQTLTGGVSDVQAAVSDLEDRERARGLETRIETLAAMLKEIEVAIVEESRLLAEQNKIEGEKIAAAKAREAAEAEARKVAAAKREAEARAVAERQRQVEEAQTKAYWTDKDRRFERLGDVITAYEKVAPGVWRKGHTFAPSEVPDYVRVTEVLR